MPELTIGAGYVKALLELAVSKGANKRALLQRCDISSAVLVDRDNRVSLDNYQRLMAAAKSLCDEPALAIQLGEAASLSDVSIVGLIVKCSGSNIEIFKQINRFGKLVVEVDGHKTAGRFQLQREANDYWMVDTRSNPDRFPELSESAFSMMISMQKQSGYPSFAKSVHFTHAAPDDPSEYERILAAPIVFGSDKNAIMIDTNLMSLTFPKADEYAFGIFSEWADALLQSLKESKTVRGQVEGLLLPILHTGEWNMQEIAEKLGLGKQTLYRKLKAENTSFEKLLDELRHKMAVEYLNGKKLP